MKNYLVSHNVCNVNCNGVIVSFRLCRSRNACRYWFIAEWDGRCRTYQSIFCDSSCLCLSNLACFASFLGGVIDYSSYADTVDMLEHLFSDVVFAGGIIK